MSIYAMLISNYFSYLIYCVKTFVFLIIIIRKVVVIRFSHRTQYLITTSVDITFINLTTEYYEQKQLLSKSMSHSNLPRDFFFFFLVKRCSPLFWLIWKVVAIRFSHRKQCHIATSFDILPLVPLSFHLTYMSCQ